MNRSPLLSLLLVVAASLIGACFTGCSAEKGPDTATPQGVPGQGTPGASASPAASGPLSFRSVTKEAGINYEWKITVKRPLNVLQTIGNGCAFLDYDSDGNLDILLVGPQVALYKGDGKGHFTDVSRETGVGTLKGNFLGCAAGDYDNDGFPDVYLTAYRGGVLLHNEKGKAFKDVTAAAGIPPQPWVTVATFADLNNDGYLDLYLGNYVAFGPNTDPQLCDNQGIKTACGPRFYKPEQNHVFLGSPSGQFKDVTAAWKARQADGKVEGKSLGIAAADFDGSGKVSIAIANDEMPADLLKNKGGAFENIGKISSMAYDDRGNVYGGMGIDWGDYDNDGKLDLVVATFYDEMKNIYHNDGAGLFTDRSAMMGMATSMKVVTFGIKWLDYDNDGYLDLLLTNGHIQDNIAEIDKANSYRQPMNLYHNQAGKRMEEVSASVVDAAGRTPIVGRGLAIGDYDNDGKVDALLVDSEGAPVLLHNETPNAGHYLTVKLVGTKANRDGLGANVEAILPDGRKLLRHCARDGSFMSASDPRVHFGTGSATQIKTLTVTWPGGKKTTLTDIATDKQVEMREQ